MNPRDCSFILRVLSFVTALAIALAPLPAAAGPAAADKEEPKQAEPAPEATVSGDVALLRFTGDVNDMRISVQDALKSEGFTIKTVALTIEAAAKKVKCRKDDFSDDCLAKLGKWLNKKKKTRSDFIVYSVTAEGVTTLVMYDIAKGERVKEMKAKAVGDDVILPLAMPKAAGQALAGHMVPPDPITPEEETIIAELDEPAKTPEELAAEKRAIADAEKEAENAARKSIDTEGIEVDLKKDFKDFCRTGKRKKRESRDDPKDLRPKCQRGAFWGYWQPRAWVTMGLAIGALGTMAGFYALALAKRPAYKDAVDALEQFESDAGSCDPRTDPNCAVIDGVAYADLATEVSKTSSAIRENAIIGDAMLGATVLLVGVLGIMIFQDRRDAKKYIKTEKGLRAIADVKIGPMIGKRSKGAALGFRF